MSFPSTGTTRPVSYTHLDVYKRQLVIHAALEGLKDKAELMPAADINLFYADEETVKPYKKLPQTIIEACAVAGSSDFIKAHIPEMVLQIYCNQ